MQRVVGLIVVASVFWHGIAWAGLDSELGQMFQSWGISGGATVNQGGAYQSQQRGFLSGGSVSVRVYRRPLPPLVSFSRPRFNVGCNGIDVYLGAFSYAKLDRFVQMLQQLGMGVVAGYAFKLAMKELCETCSNVMDNLESAIRSLNALTNLQPCQASVRQIENTGKKIMNAGSELWDSIKAAEGELSDRLEGKGKKPDADKLADMNKNDETRVSFNLVHDPLKKAGVDDDTIRLIMSATGTLTVNNNGTPKWVGATLSLDQLVDLRPGDSATILMCGDESCLTVDEVEIPPGDITGLGKRVRDAMESIADKLVNRTVELTTEERKMVEMSPLPFMVKLRQQSVERKTMAGYIERNAEVVSVEMARKWIEFAVHEALKTLDSLKELHPNAALSPEMERNAREALQARVWMASADADNRLQRLTAAMPVEVIDPHSSRGKAVHEAYKTLTQDQPLTQSTTMAK
ncbi:MAG: conjugal transfer protein TraH [Nitrospirota bacterium]